MLFGAEVFAGNRFDFGFFEQVVGHVAGSLELLAPGGLVVSCRLRLLATQRWETGDLRVL